MALIFLSYLRVYNKNEIFADYWDTSISSTKKKIGFFLTFLPDILMTTKQHTTKLFREFWGTQYYFTFCFI
jgi:hypothetical protein